MARKVVLHPMVKTTLASSENVETVIPHATVFLLQIFEGSAINTHFIAIFRKGEFYYLPLFSSKQSGNVIEITGSQMISLLSTLNLHQRLEKKNQIVQA